MPDTPHSPAEPAVGVDGGAGTLKFTVRASDGALTHHSTPGANPILAGMETFLQRLTAGLDEALGAAGVDPASVYSAGLALSGVDRLDQVEQIKRFLRDGPLANCSSIWIGNDALAALRQGAGELRGLVLIAGTGSICIGVDDEGLQLRAGGWGSGLGDEGSAYWIGERALQRGCRIADGRAEPSPLLDALLEKLRLSTPEDLISWSADLTRETWKQQCAALFPLVDRLARKGDSTAQTLIAEAAFELVLLASTVWRRLSENDELAREARAGAADVESSATDNESSVNRPMKIVCAGGVFTSSDAFFARFRDAFTAAWKPDPPPLEITRLDAPASLGALALGEEFGSV